MPISDYAHWNEEAPRVWWEEEGRHADEPNDDESWREDCSAADAYAEELAEASDDDLHDMLFDEEYIARWPQARRLIEAEMADRGLIPVEPS